MDQGTEVALAPGEPVQGRKAGPGLCRTARWGSRQEACVSCRGAPPSIQHHCWGTEPMCSPGPWQVCGPLCAKKRLPLGSCPQYQVEERERPSQARWTGGRQSERTNRGQSRGTCPTLQPVAAPPSLVTPAPAPPQTAWQSSLFPSPRPGSSVLPQAIQSPCPAHLPGTAAFFCPSSFGRRQALGEQGFRGSFVILNEPQHLESHAWLSPVIDRTQSLVQIRRCSCTDQGALGEGALSPGLWRGQRGRPALTLMGRSSSGFW